MARIPLYQQKQLASSMVGVPQMDSSGQQVAQDILQGTGHMANVAAGAQDHAAALAEHALNYSLGQFESALGDVQREKALREHQQAQAESQQQTLLDSMNANTHTNLWNVQANEELAALSQDTEVPPDLRPKETFTRLNTLRDDYMKQNYMSDGAKMKFMAATNTDIAGAHKSATDTWRTYASQKAVIDGKVADGKLALATKTLPDLQALQAKIASERDIRLWKYGANASKADDRLMHMAQLNVANNLAQNNKPFLKKGKDGVTEESTTLDLAIEGGHFDKLSSGELGQVKNYGDHVLKGAIADDNRYAAIQKHVDVLNAEGVRGAILKAENTQDYGATLAQGRQDLIAKLKEEEKKPLFINETVTPRFKDNKRVDYRSDAVYNHISSLIEWTDGRLENYSKSYETQYKEVLKGFAAEDKQTTAIQTSTIEAAKRELAIMHSKEGNALFDRALTNINHLQNLRIPDPEQTHLAKGQQPHEMSNDEVQAFMHATAAYATAVKAGAVDNKTAAQWHKYLRHMGDQFQNGKPTDQDRISVEGALTMLTKAAPQGLHYLMGQYGYNKTATDKELLSRTIDMYHQFKNVNHGMEPTQSVVEIMRKKAVEDMKSHAAARKQQLIPPPPAIPLFDRSGFAPVLPAYTPAPQAASPAVQESTPSLPNVNEVADF